MHREPRTVQFKLRDGTPVWLRPVVPEDRERIQNGMARLSSESRYFRFFTTSPRLSEQQLRYFSEVDQENHVAWIGLDLADPRHPGLGITRFTRSRGEPTLAEMAFVVVDAYQQRGLGTVLLALLYLLAEARAVEVLRAVVLGENFRVWHWLGSLGAKESCEAGEYRLDLRVYRDRDLLPHTPAGENFRHTLEALQRAVRGPRTTWMR